MRKLVVTGPQEQKSTVKTVSVLRNQIIIIIMRIIIIVIMIIIIIIIITIIIK